MKWNFFSKTYSFTEAIKALKEGKRIKRKKEKKGYAKSIGDRYITYWIDDGKTFEQCLFTLDDIFAEDWIINP